MDSDTNGLDTSLVNFAPSPQTKSILGEVHESRAELASLGAFTREQLAELRLAFLPSRISDTLNIEGIRVNPRLTRAVMEGQAIAASDRYAEDVILNTIEACDLVAELANKPELITQAEIRGIHGRLLRGVRDDAGSYRSHEVEITGSKHRPPHGVDVPILMQRVCEALSQDIVHADSVIVSVWMHWRITQVHPFADGNGRTARLIQDYVLARTGLLPVGIPATHREAYYDALAQADSGNLDDLVALVAHAEAGALKKAIYVARQGDVRRARLGGIMQRASSKVKNQHYLKYEVWRRMCEGVTAELRMCCDELNEMGQALTFLVFENEPPTFDVWQALQSGERTRNWLARVHIKLHGRTLYTSLFYCRRHEFAGVELLPGESIRSRKGYMAVAIFLTGALPSEQFVFTHYTDPVISLREILLENEGLIAYRAQQYHAPAESSESLDFADVPKWVGSSPAPALEILTSYLEDLVRKVGLSD